ncbi:MAG: hypothetical protein LBU81_06350 [Methanosarcinales archaeon]|nr:hypothetical protein [Methanosarcinales archaeon]
MASFGDTSQGYQSVGNKGLHRFFISVKVLDTINLQKELFKMVRFGINQNKIAFTYAAFTAEFYGLFQLTYLLTKDEELVGEIERFFGAETDLKFGKDVKNMNRSIDLFKQYMVQMKKDGIYDPSIFHTFNHPSNAMEESL